MKILVVSHEYPPIGGGGANACYFLTREYVAKGHEVTVLTARFQNNDKEEDINGVHLVRVNAMRKKQEKSNLLEMFIFLLNAWGQAIKLQKRDKFHICQVFFGIPSGPIAFYLKHRFHIPYIVRFGGGDIPGAQKRYAVIYQLLNPFVRQIWKHASGLVANSEGLQHRAEQFEKRYPITCISNGVDIDFFKPPVMQKNNHARDLEILFVSRLIEGKGLQDVIPNMKMINDAVENKVILRVVGDGPYRAELERLTKQQGMQEFVCFEGRKSKQELLYFYQHADVFILPSRSEGMPNVVLEAMAMGLPIVMTPCEGSKELIHNNGYSSPISQFTESIIELCKDEHLRNEFGKNSIEIVHKAFNWADKADQYLTLMTTCLPKKV